jgi:hypothetical protein
LVQLKKEEQPAEMIAIARIQESCLPKVNRFIWDIHRKQERLFGGILTPKYDLQSDIYADMLKNWKNQLLI